MSRNILLFLPLLFIVNYAFSQNIEGVTIDTSLTDLEIDFQDSVALINKHNEMIFHSRKKYNYGLDQFNNNNLKDAIISFTNSIVIDSTFSKAYLYRGRCYDSFDDSLALLDYDLAFSFDSTDFSPLYDIAKIQSVYDINEAINTYNLIISLSNQESKAYYEIGVLFYLQEDIQRAVDCFTSSIVLKQDARALNDRASCYRSLDNNELAIKDYILAISLDSTLAFVYNNLASIYRHQGDSDNALNYYTLAITQDPYYALAYNNRGSLYIDLNDIEKALNDIEKAILIQKDYSVAYNNKAVIYHKKKRYDKAITYFDIAISLDSDYAKAFLNRGITRQIIRDEEGACSDWMKARELGINIANDYFQNDCN